MSLLVAATPAWGKDPKCPKVRTIQGAVTKAWVGKTVVCLASGPSVTVEQLELIRAARASDSIRVIVVNDMYLVAPWADAHYFADSRWAKWHIEGTKRVWPWATFHSEEVRRAFLSFSGQRVTIEHADTFDDPGAFYLKNFGPDGISETPYAICTGSNSGYQALNIAVLSGASLILLVGYDMKFDGKRSHSHSGHSIPMPESAYRSFARKFSTMERQLERLRVKVINCTPGSMIDVFPRGGLRECLAPIA